jgi:hypothetical protein
MLSTVQEFNAVILHYSLRISLRYMQNVYVQSTRGILLLCINVVKYQQQMEIR